MLENTIHSHERAVADINRMLDAMDKPKKVISEELRRSSERADQMVLDDPQHRERVVIGAGGHCYQIFLRETADKWEHKFLYSTEEGFVNDKG